MKKRIFFLLFIISAVFSYAQQAKLDFPTSFDLGKISGKDSVTVEIPISNPSDERVSFTTVSSCNCIEINNFTSSIPANSSVFVPITFHPEGYSGNQSFIITLIYNDNREKILLNCEVDSGNLNETAADIEDNVFIHYTSDEKLLNQSNSFCFFSYKNCGSCKKIIKTFLKIYPDFPIQRNK